MKSFKNYSCTDVSNLLNKYSDKGGNIHQIEEGCLGHGFIICEGENLKTLVVNEYYVNAWNSLHSIKLYNRDKTPKKYLNIIENN
jgi:hypothetical protein